MREPDTIIPLRELTTNSSQHKNHQTPPISPRHLTRSNTNCNGVHTNGSKNVLLPPTSGSTRRSHLRRVKLPSDSPKNNSFGFSFKGKEKKLKDDSQIEVQVEHMEKDAKKVEKKTNTNGDLAKVNNESNGAKVTVVVDYEPQKNSSQSHTLRQSDNVKIL